LHHTPPHRGPTSPDYFSITAAAGPATLQLLVAPVSAVGAPRADVNASVTLLSAAGVVLKSMSGVGIAPFDVTLPAAGSYAVAVAPTGAGDPTTTGYTVYGSRGQFQLSVTYPYTSASAPSPSPAPVAPPPSPPGRMTITGITNALSRTSSSVSRAASQCWLDLVAQLSSALVTE
jgi:hypothetical protein